MASLANSTQDKVEECRKHILAARNPLDLEFSHEEFDKETGEITNYIFVGKLPRENGKFQVCEFSVSVSNNKRGFIQMREGINDKLNSWTFIDSICV